MCGISNINSRERTLVSDNTSQLVIADIPGSGRATSVLMKIDLLTQGLGLGVRCYRDLNVT